MLRKTTQDLAPLQHKTPQPGQYDIYPAFPAGDGKISVGYRSLAEQIKAHPRVVIDGYGGVFWDQFHASLDRALRQAGVTASWMDIRIAYLPEAQLDSLVAPFLGGDDPLFGTRFTGTLADFFGQAALATIQPDQENTLSIVYGPGAALAGWDDALLVYVDVPKNEIQFRSRAGAITNLGCAAADSLKTMYKRFYFVDWVALNRHKANLLPAMDLIVDSQRPDAPVFMSGDDLRHTLGVMSRNYFRVRPWFEPGAWGGQWMRSYIPQLPQDVPNYAWSFELIVPENGLMIESDGNLLEVSFDFLMYDDHRAIVGQSAERFGTEFPIRFDFLDTFDGGNLSLQCHPRPEYIAQHFGETFTQDETYYILDCETGAQVYLGFQAGINPEEFRHALETSQTEGNPVDVERFVQVHPAAKHDLFLIPNGTVHCSGVNNMVLEISATPYIFTFKMYDWLRLDLDGKPRPLNIKRAFENLHFERQGELVQRELLAKPYQKARGDGWRLIHLPTHPVHFYDVHRYEIEPGMRVSVETNDSCQVMSLVEGTTILLETANEMQQRFSYAETFVVPAAATRFQLVNDTTIPAKVVIAFNKGETE